MKFLWLFIVWMTFGRAHAQNILTLDALARLEEILTQKLETQEINLADHGPVLLIEAKPFYQDSLSSFRSAVLKSITNVFTQGSVRDCQRCEKPYVYEFQGRLIHSTGHLDFQEIRNLDQMIRGTQVAAKSAMWVQETRNGVSLNMVNLYTGQVVFAQNITPELEWTQRSRANFTRSEIYAMRARGERISHAFMDAGGMVGGHWSFDWSEQWGVSNRNLTGFTISLITPILGVGVNYGRIFPNLWNASLGGKFMLSIPSLLVNNLSKGRTSEVIDPLVTFMGFARIPFTPRSNFGGFIFVTSSAKLGIGISTFSINLLPVAP